MSRYKVLSEEEIRKALDNLSPWELEKENITAKYEFASFSHAVGFISRVFLLAEELDHHPEFFFSYNTVEFKFCTHDVGFKVTNVDLETAKRIQNIAESMLKN